jgi:nucleoside-diphosphate-sugar epimerase
VRETSGEPLRAAVDAELANQRVVVTGARGFLGTPLSRRLQAAGAEVHAVSRTGGTDRGADGVRWWRVNLEDSDAVQTLLNEVKPAIIFHLAGRVTGAPDLELVAATFSSLLASTVTLLSAATRIGCRRIVLTGSLEEPRGDTAMAAPASPYAAAKWAAGGYARMFHRLYQTPTVVVRPFFTYGPAQPGHRVVPYTILSYLHGRPPRLSSGSRQLDWVYLDDVIDGLLLAACRPGLEGCTIELGSGHAVAVRDVAMLIKELVGSPLEPEFGAEAERPADETRVADIAPTFARLGWRALTTLDTGLALTVAWYRNHYQRRSER